MSVQTIQSNIERLQRDISSLYQKLTDESKKEAAKTERISQIKRSITSNTSQSMMQSKLRDIEWAERDLVAIQKKRADLTKQLADKNSELSKRQQELFREQEREQKKMMDSFKRKDEENRRRQDDLLRQVRQATQTVASSVSFAEAPDVAYDAFISHAKEDKEELVGPLAEKLREAGFSIWYDDFQLKVGDHLRRSIDKGLVNSRFGIVVLSPAFFSKNWPKYELDGLVAKEMVGNKVILPLWHKVSKDEVMSYSPSLADRIALNTAMFTVEELTKELATVLKGEADK